jgi:agmatinase
MRLTTPPGEATFLGQEAQDDLAALAADFAVLGAPFGVPYDMRGVASDAAEAPAAVRARSQRYGAMRDHYDFDAGGEMLPTGLRVVDCGDVAAAPGDLLGNKSRVTEAVRTILDRGATPIVLGGDDSVPALVLAAFDGLGPLTVLQIDAHLDFRDEVRGIRDGYSSPMRRASEMSWVEKIVHVGIRGVGSARRQEVEETRAAGNVIITARELREDGVARVLREFPEGGNYFVTLDCDGFDPSVMPGTLALVPAGVSYSEGADLIRGLAQRGTVVGMDFAEHYPSRDINGITSLCLVRLIVTLMANSRLRK